MVQENEQSLPQVTLTISGYNRQFISAVFLWLDIIHVGFAAPYQKNAPNISFLKNADN